MTDTGRPAQRFDAAEPTPITNADGTVTLVEGSTFCLSGSTGDIRPGTSHGLFFRDARVISRWQLRLDGQPLQALSVLAGEAFAARFLLRRPPPADEAADTPLAGHAESTLLVVRERLVGDGMRETITLDNFGREPATINAVMYVEADFADLFAVKEMHASGGGQGGAAPGTAPGQAVPGNTAADGGVADAKLLLRERAGGPRGVSVSASASPVIGRGALNWRIVVPPKGRWATEIIVQPTLQNHPVRPQFKPGQRLDDSGPARRIGAWRAKTTVITADDPVLSLVLGRIEGDLGMLRAEDRTGRAFVSAGVPWFMTLFGRDSLLAAWMALPLDVDLAIGTLQTLAESQGDKIDPATEEEPGRILHEQRSGPESFRVFGGTHYYGTVDATPLFVMLLAECWRWGADDRTVRALLPAADAALSWIEKFGDRDGDGFVEYQRATGRGLVNQGWKDSADAINDADGRTASPPIALCEVQAYVYAALLARAELADGFGDPSTATRCRARAGELRQRFAESFWLPDRGWYAVALDGRKQQVDALSSNVAHCLWAGIATDEHAAKIVQRLAAGDMDSGYGLRTLAASMGAYNPMSYHNGSVWPHDTSIAVAGLLRYGHLEGAAELAQRLALGLLDAAAAFRGRLPELFCGFARADFGTPVPYPTSCSPQAWASAAPLLLLRSFLGLEPHVPHRRLYVSARLPACWGTIALSGLRLGPATVHITAAADHATVRGLPHRWRCDIGEPD